MHVLFHVQHLLGIGHLRRAALIVRALEAAGARITVAQGGFPVAGVGFGGADVVQLPPARAADARFSGLVDAAGAAVTDEWRSARRDRVLSVFASAAPDVVLIESYPFGRRALVFELAPLLSAARTRRGCAPGRPVIACSVRDILVAKPSPARWAEAARIVRASFDLVLVHGDPGLIGFDATFPLATAIEDRLAYTGYVAAEAPADTDADADEPTSAGAEAPDGTGEVIVSVGGGAVGVPLLTAAIAARARSATAARRRWRLLAGGDVPDDTVAALRASAAVVAGDGGLVVERARPDFPALLRRCAVSVSLAGYNTVLDILQAGCRAVLVPFAGDGRETEQGLRARLLADRGRVMVVDDAGLTPTALAAAVDAAAAGPPPQPIGLALDGARQTARLLVHHHRLATAKDLDSATPFATS